MGKKWLKEIDKFQAYNLVEQYHYSKVMPRLTKHYIGLFEGKNFVGVVTLGWGTQPKGTINKLIPGKTTKDYFEIGKMCLLDSCPRNSESAFLALVVKWMKQNTFCDFLYTLADGIVGKVGYVYQASNFLYGGYFWTDVYIAANGEKVHPRTTKPLLRENETFLAIQSTRPPVVKKLFWLTKDFMQHKGIKRVKGKMFRYMYPLSKKARRHLKNLNWNLNHPKDTDLEWKVLNFSTGKYDVTTTKPFMDLSVVKYNQRNITQYKQHEGDINGPVGKGKARFHRIERCAAVRAPKDESKGKCKTMSPVVVKRSYPPIVSPPLQSDK